MTMTIAEQNYVNEIAEIKKNYEEKVAILDRFENLIEEYKVALKKGKISNDELNEVVRVCKNAPIEDKPSRIAALFLIEKFEEKLNK